MKYTLLGSLGNITKPLAAQLIAAGHEVTIVSSNAGKQAEIATLGAKASIGSVEDTAFLTSAFIGADAIYTMIPPTFTPSNWKAYIHNIGKNLAAAIQASGVKKVVNLSSIGAHMPDGCGPVSGLHFAEQELDKVTGADIKHLRPGYFFTNLYHSIPMIREAGILGNNFGENSPIILVHPRDIAAVAAEELLHLSFTGKSFRYIASDEKNSTEIAAALGATIGKPDLLYVAFSDEAFLNGALQAGLPQEIAQNFVEMGTAIRSQKMFADYRKHRIIPGKTKLEDFAQEFAAAYAHA